MGERKYTFVEYHSHGNGPSFFPDIFGGREDQEEEIDVHAEEEEEDGGSTALRVLLALVVLIGVAVAVKYFTGDEEEAEEPFDTREVAVTEYED